MHRPYGSWPSPISAEALASKGISLSFYFGVADGETCYFSVPDPEDGGRVRLFKCDGDSKPDYSGLVELLPGRYVRSALQEYGGGDWAVSDGVVVYSDFPSGELRLLRDGVDSLLAPGGDYRYGSISVYPSAGIALAVREDHSGSAEALTTIVSAALDGSGVSVLCGDARRGYVDDVSGKESSDTHDCADGKESTGSDFYASPTLSEDGRLAWVEWDHPNMPWDTTRVCVAPLAHPEDVSVVAGPAPARRPGTSARRPGTTDAITPSQDLIRGGEHASNVYPMWSPDGTLIFISDAAGYWNFYHWDGSTTVALYPKDADFCQPMWNPHPAPYTLIDAQTIGCTWLEDGFAKFGKLHIDSHDLEELPFDAVSTGNYLPGTGRYSLAHFGYIDRPDEYVRIDWETGTAQTLFSSGERSLAENQISQASPIHFEGAAGQTHAWFYPPANGDLTGVEGELPPVIVLTHGGPTSFSSPHFSKSYQYWTTRGIAVLDVNYSGSSGYGRAYRDRLQGQWGVLDVADCVAAVETLIARGLIDGDRVAIKGGSAGGYTTLRALTSSDVFAGGISYYGIGDLEALAKDTHKFESRYLDGLVAPYPERRDVYIDRSPIYHLDNLTCPMLILQGEDDKVVPPAQATEMAQAVEAKGLPVTLIMFPGEGHGFRKPESLLTAQEAELTFLSQVFEFEPA
ncbi:MAG: prolyl oligopeptidase family serine peptidase [Propionibacteriaceae bacterium]|jgi:dienelactone hydrolase|nr:prolyl oligopeptidase family serine peptidase [Propionibacteriaceae bacterium]